ncbi:MAG: UvrD-helicase domain-containing protein [Bacteroidales bacterium]|jgi:ATP-dependent exoDNAse (exonuclease V) beta subunit|nr:UvrD-helicase domain-containing protein [Bacteroidales bacterium]
MEKQNKFRVYSASAGSGKTFSLVVEYISILMENPENYAHILAVTFTNKATAEMKQRIMQVLYGLSNADENYKGYREKIQEKTGKTDIEIRTTSEIALHKILHDYSRFSIETIDSFFQRVLRNMTRELGLGASFNVILDDSTIIEEAIRHSIDHMTENAELKEWYREFIQERIRDGKKWNVERDLLAFAKALTKETFKVKGVDLEKLSDPAILKPIKEGCAEFCKEIRDSLANFSNEFEKQFDLEKDNFVGGKNGAVLQLFTKIKTPEKWFELLNPDPETAKTIKKAVCEGSDLVKKLHSEQAVRAFFDTTYRYLETHFKAYNTAKLLLKDINSLGLLAGIHTCKRHIMAQNNVFLLSETAQLLSAIIMSDEGLDISFVFEKMGERYHYIMIDEFQDTSQLNWNNFKLLLAESLDNNKTSIIVGDAKQSIYRFNNGDWKIFSDLRNKGFSLNSGKNYEAEAVILDKNFRTGEYIVTFNNELFTGGLQDGIFADKDLLEKINAIYTPKDTQIAYKKGSGRIVCQIFEGKGEKRTEKSDDTDEEVIDPSDSLEFVRKEITDLYARGYEAKDITILCKEKKEIRTIIDHFLEKPLMISSEKPLSFVSAEAFYYRSALSVRVVINILSYVFNPQNTTALEFVQIACGKKNAAALRELQTDRTSLLNKSLFDLVLHSIHRFNLFDYREEYAFLFSFLDAVHEYSTRYSAHIAAFLQYWNESLQEKSIPLSAGAQGDSVQLLTVHSSKGLEFPAVIIPFCNWKFVKTNDHIHNNYLWISDCETTQEKLQNESDIPVDLSELQVLPAIKSSLKNTYFESVKHQEERLETIDNLNALYVAFTRPEQSLAICGTNSDTKGKQDRKKNVADLLYRFLETQPETQRGERCVRYAVNETEQKHEKTEKRASIFSPEETPIIPEFSAQSAEITYSQTKKAEQFVDGFVVGTEQKNDTILSPQMLGIALHGILADIVQVRDTEAAIQKALLRGDIRADHEAEINETICAMLLHKEVQSWFDGSYRVLNEAEIICKNEHSELVSYRPDRVMIAPNNEVVLVDYKFAESEKALPKYEKQVRNYVKLLREIGYKTVSAYVWFALHNNVIIPVE